MLKIGVMKKMSNYFDSKNRFLSFAQFSHFLRVDDNHPLNLYLGLNDNGQRTLRLIGQFKRKSIKSTRIIQVTHLMIDRCIAVDFSLLDDEYADLFYLFCNDLVDSSRDCAIDSGYEFIYNRYEKWRTFGLNKKRFISESEIKGLLGELLFLRDYLIPKYGISASLGAWTAIEPTKKDFSFESTWYEIKSATGSTITISSIDQLTSDYAGHLIVYRFEKVAPSSFGVTLNSIVRSLLDSTINFADRTELIIKLTHADYYQDEYYDDYSYAIIEKTSYSVNGDFPRIDPIYIDPAISKVKFDLIINMLEKYKENEIWI